MNPENLEGEIREIKKDIGYIKETLLADRIAIKEHIDSSQAFRDKVIRLEETVKSHAAEHVYYRWLFGIIISVGIALLLKK